MYFNPRSPQGERLALSSSPPVINKYFNPRSPQGERLSPAFALSTTASFQSTLPAGGATAKITNYSTSFLLNNSISAKKVYPRKFYAFQSGGFYSEITQSHTRPKCEPACIFKTAYTSRYKIKSPSGLYEVLHPYCSIFVNQRPLSFAEFEML